MLRCNSSVHKVVNYNSDICMVRFHKRGSNHIFGVFGKTKKKLTRFRPCINITAYVVRQEQENGTAQQILRKEVTVMFNTMKFRESAGIGIQVNKTIREITSAGREEDLRRLW